MGHQTDEKGREKSLSKVIRTGGEREERERETSTDDSCHIAHGD
jgi:hypothetical protein